MAVTPEFKLIEKYFRPLCQGFDGAFDLKDDAAALTPDMVVTTDCLISGVHFIETATPEQVARKVMGANLSDLAAKGVKPFGYTLAIALTGAEDDDWLARFAGALKIIQDEVGFHLIGGDTVSTPGPLMLTVTAFGKGEPILRSGAKIGDCVYVTGTIGDGALGLKVALGDLANLEEDHQDHLLDRYHCPQPRLDTGLALQGRATAAADISDGLLADLNHICEASTVGADIDAGRVPLSVAAMKALELDPALYDLVLTGGDDYELVFTGPSGLEKDLSGITAIGQIVEGEGVCVLDIQGNIMETNKLGYSHR